MAQLTPRDLHVDRLLTNISLAYRNKRYIADLIFPVVPVQRQSDVYPSFDQSHWFRDSAALRGPRTESRRGGFTATLTNTYYCARYSYGYEIDDDTRSNSETEFDLDNLGTEFVTDKLQLRREIAFATDFFAASKGWTDVTGGSTFVQWSDYAGSSPLVNVTDFADDMEAAIGVEPNTFVIGKEVWVQLKWHPDLMDTIKYTQRAQITPELVASLFEIDRLLIGRAIYTTSPELTAEASVTYTRIWGKAGLLLYVPDRPSLLTPAAGYTFVWNRVPNAIQYIKRLRNEDKEIDVIEGSSYFDQKQTGAKAGTYLATAVA